MSETKTAEEAIELIKGRIMDEYRKHQTLDWSNIAARKIHSQWFEYYNQQNQELQSKINLFDQSFSNWKQSSDAVVLELQRQVEEYKRYLVYEQTLCNQIKDAADEMAKQIDEFYQGRDNSDEFLTALNNYKHLTNKP